MCTIIKTHGFVLYIIKDGITLSLWWQSFPNTCMKKSVVWEEGRKETGKLVSRKNDEKVGGQMWEKEEEGDSMYIKDMGDIFYHFLIGRYWRWLLVCVCVCNLPPKCYLQASSKTFNVLRITELMQFGWRLIEISV